MPVSEVSAGLELFYTEYVGQGVPVDSDFALRT